jgi:hypothetical protein
MSKLLIDEAPLQVLPTLAKAIGLNEAIVLQQTHFRLQISEHKRNGHTWLPRSYEKWMFEFPFWSEPTLRRTISNLETRGLLISTDVWNVRGSDRTKWYAIDYGALGLLKEQIAQESLIKMIRPPDQSDQLSLEEVVKDFVVVVLDPDQEQQQCLLSSLDSDPRVRVMLEHSRLGHLIVSCDLLDSVPTSRLLELVEQYGLDRVAEVSRWYCWQRDRKVARTGGWLVMALREEWSAPEGWREEMYLSEAENLKRYGKGWDDESVINRDDHNKHRRSSKWEEIER